MFDWILAVAAAGLGLGSAAAVLMWWVLRRRAMDRWLGPYVLQIGRRHAPCAGQEVHLLLCFADHFEPKADGATPDRSRARVDHWVSEYPRQFARFRDSDGRPPRYTFFYPIEEYEPEYLDALAGLCCEGFGEVEIHLHHHKDTSAKLRASLLAFKNLLHTRHGLLPVNRATGEVQFGFIHGNWALNNSMPGGRFCGVNDELEILRETGCYADFTLPSAPSPAQTSTINSIYYADTSRRWPKSHDRGVAAGSGKAPASSILLIQGPLVLDWSRRKHGWLPTVENGCLQASQPPDIARLPLWLRACIQIPQRPDWFFVKLHAHGAEEHSHHALLGEPMVNFHAQLAEHARANPHFHFHYVTAREMYNLCRAAEDGFGGGVAAALDYQLVWPAHQAARCANASTAFERLG